MSSDSVFGIIPSSALSGAAAAEPEQVRPPETVVARGERDHDRELSLALKLTNDVAMPCTIEARLHAAIAIAYPSRVPTRSINRPTASIPAAYAAENANTRFP